MIAFFVSRVAAVEICISVLRVKLDSLSAIGDSSVMVALLVPCTSAGGIRVIVCRVDLDRLSVIGYRFVKVAFKLSLDTNFDHQGGRSTVGKGMRKRVGLRVSDSD